MSGQGDITDPKAWEDGAGHVPPLVYQNVPSNTNYPLNGDGRYWWTGNAASDTDSTTVSLVAFDGANGATSVSDLTGNLTFTMQDGFVLSTTTPKFGTAALAMFPGSANFTTVYAGSGYPANPACYANLTTATNVYGTTGYPDFTMECWVWIDPSSSTAVQVFDYGSQNYNSTVGLKLTISGTQIAVQPTNAWTGITYSTTISKGVWHHVAVVRYGGVGTLYLDGVVTGSPAGNWTSNPGTPVCLSIGSSPNSFGGAGTGYVDEFRLSNVARYTAAFTPPVAPFSPDVLANAIKFIGDTTDNLIGTAALTWQLTQLSTDGSAVEILYSTDGGNNYTTVTLPNALQGLQSGKINVPLTGAVGLSVGVIWQGVPLVGATTSNVAVAITRNEAQGPVWDYPSGLDPSNYNGVCTAETTYDDLETLQNRMMIRLGFAAQVDNPPPGMIALITEFLQSAQNYLFRRYTALNMRRFFRWKLVPGQRFYSLADNDEDPMCAFMIDPTKTIEWAGMQDSRNVWYPMVEGIDPQLYTMVSKPWRPARYEIRQGLEVYPAPDQTYWLWLKGSFGLQSFVNPTDQTTLDSELVFLWALANGKAHYGQPDAQQIAAQANTFRKDLIAGTHGTKRYIPGALNVPPAVRPTLLSFNG